MASNKRRGGAASARGSKFALLDEGDADEASVPLPAPVPAASPPASSQASPEKPQTGTGGRKVAAGRADMPLEMFKRRDSSECCASCAKEYSNFLELICRKKTDADTKCADCQKKIKACEPVCYSPANVK